MWYEAFKPEIDCLRTLRKSFHFPFRFPLYLLITYAFKDLFKFPRFKAYSNVPSGTSYHTFHVSVQHQASVSWYLTKLIFSSLLLFIPLVVLLLLRNNIVRAAYNKNMQLFLLSETGISVLFMMGVILTLNNTEMWVNSVQKKEFLGNLWFFFTRT